jgi:hypothetical protein
VVRSECLVHSVLMKHGRIVRVTPQIGVPYTTYIVAEESAQQAVALMRTLVGSDAEVESIGRASLELLSALSLSPGQYRRIEES